VARQKREVPERNDQGDPWFFRPDRPRAGIVSAPFQISDDATRSVMVLGRVVDHRDRRTGAAAIELKDQELNIPSLCSVQSRPV
jgi:hypothetical protein